MPNRLANESSPYLQQHKDNPVDWYPWGNEALERARVEDKPILVSIGYSACHWCHVMAHESFEDPAVAELLNEHFISIKVDREERPDIDSVCMTAVQAMTGQGGWPLNCFMTPEGVPFFGGTYWPPEDRMGMPSFRRVLDAVSETWETRRDEILAQGGQIREALARQPIGNPGAPDVDLDTIDQAVLRLRTQFDPVNGGIGGAPKFPQSSVFEFLLRAWKLTGDDQALEMTTMTLERMAAGGIHDQIGGGFHRYAVDDIWLVPHFEKMLYDNAQLARLFLDAYRATGNERFAAVVRTTLDYLLREMTSPGGAFYSAQDADSEGEEGKFFVWTPDEVRAVLDPDDAAFAVGAFAITGEGNFEGKSIPTFTGADPERTDRVRTTLYEARSQRVWPGRDEKIIAAWNGMAIRTFAEASRTFDDARYREAAIRAVRFIKSSLDISGTLHRIFGGGKAAIPAFLEDYAQIIDGAIATYEATFDLGWLEWAADLTDRMIDRFRDGESGLFFDTSAEHDVLVVRARDIQDGATPCGSSVAADVLIRMAHFTGRSDYLDVASAILRPMTDYMEDQPAGFGRYLSAACRNLATVREVAIAAPADAPEVNRFASAVFSRFEPSALVARTDPADTSGLERIPWLQDRPMRAGQPTAYLCEQFVCLPPVTVADDLVMQLEMGTGMTWQAF